ncbi:MAG TPA: hypothetical protein VHB47_02655 [Thermoanaerobaculia bacterium]|nr:hypothetical protein [Thermoanaerobaculia bacterium]
MATARILSRQRRSTSEIELVLEGSLANADQGMVNAFTGGFRVAQTKLAIEKAMHDPDAVAAALESAQIVALGILVREQMQPAQFEAVYRPFATILPGPGYRPPPPVDRQMAAFLKALPRLTGEPEAEVAAVAKAMSEQRKPAVPAPAGSVVLPTGMDPAARYSAAWKSVIGIANQSGRTYAFRAAQDSAEQAAPHDGLGIVGIAGVAAGGIFMRDVIPIEQVLLLYEPFAAAVPYERLG